MLLVVSKMGQGSSHRLAVSRPRREGHETDHAEVIDLVQLPSGTRPTPIAYLEYEEVERCRHMDCEHYFRCLTFAAQVKWRSFHCRQCSKNPERNETIVHQPEDEDRNLLAPVIKLW